MKNRDSRTPSESPSGLVTSNLAFVRKLALEYSDRGVSTEDLVGEGNIGLIQAAARYDPNRGPKFTTYAAWWIRKYMIEALGKYASAVRVPSYQYKKAAIGRTAGPPRPRILSLDSRGRDEADASWHDLIENVRSIDPEREVHHQECLARLRRGLECLDRRERAILGWRFGLKGDDELTLREIGSKLNLTRERVRQLEAEAIARLGVRLTGSRRAAPLRRRHRHRVFR